VLVRPPSFSKDCAYVVVKRFVRWTTF
jgi:hypothetical protein